MLICGGSSQTTHNYNQSLESLALINDFWGIVGFVLFIVAIICYYGI
jgi:hypothetical protein